MTVFADTFAFIAWLNPRDSAHAAVAAFLEDFTDPLFDVVGYVPSVYQAGFHLFSARHDKGWSLTDCISFGVMHERGLSEALTADRHFEQAGFQALFK